MNQPENNYCISRKFGPILGFSPKKAGKEKYRVNVLLKCGNTYVIVGGETLQLATQAFAIIIFFL